LSVAELHPAVAAIFAGDPAIVRDPYPVYRRLREEAPVYRYGPSLVVVSTHTLVNSVHRDNRRFVTRRSNDRSDVSALGADDGHRCEELVAFDSCRWSP
jgi:hypothetical protein